MAGRGVADRAVPVGHAADRGARRSAASRRGYVEIVGRDAAQPQERRRQGPARRVLRGDGRVGLGQVDAGQRDPLQGRREQAQPRADAAGRAQAHQGPRAPRQDHLRSTSRRSAARRARTRRPTSGSSTSIRDLYSKTQEARARGYKPGRFSFNVKGGRCEVCRGDGQIKIEMHFLPDIYVPCEQCHGKRYNRETLDIRFKGKTIADVLDMPVEEALEFFAHIPKIRRRLQTLHDVGLGLHAARPAGHDAVGRRGPAHQAGERAGQGRHRPHALHPRRADHRPALRRHPEAARGARSAWSTPATRSSSSSTTST